LRETRVTGAGLKQLSGLKKLQSLALSRSPVTHLEGLGELGQLRSLELDGTKVTDAELKELSALTHLEHLHLESTPVTDAGLRHLKGLNKLRSL
jgi:Leucine-rich repeat (LRR) protein